MGSTGIPETSISAIVRCVISQKSADLIYWEVCACNASDVILTVHRRQYVEIKCQLDATEVFIADLIACSTCFEHHYAHHQELKSIIQWLLPVVLWFFQVAGLVWS